MRWTKEICRLNLWRRAAPIAATPSCPTRDRLTRGFLRLQDIELVREHLKDPLFGRSTEQRIIWRELLEMELQELDEQLEGSLAVRGEAARID